MSDTDFAEVIEVASKHSVTGVVWNAIESVPNIVLPLSVEQKMELYGITRYIEKQNVQVNRVLFLVVDTLNNKGIPNLLLKGQGNAQFYNNPLRRVSGDIDIYVGEKHYEDALGCLLNANLVDSINHADVRHKMIICKGVSVEIHKYVDLLPGNSCNKKFQEEMMKELAFSKSCFYVNADGKTSRQMFAGATYVRTLPLSLNTVYVFIHLFRHFVAGGIRLKQLFDWLVLKQTLNMSEELVAQYIRDFGFEKPYREFETMCELFFGGNNNQIDDVEI